MSDCVNEARQQVQMTGLFVFFVDVNVKNVSRRKCFRVSWHLEPIGPFFFSSFSGLRLGLYRRVELYQIRLPSLDEFSLRCYSHLKDSPMRWKFFGVWWWLLFGKMWLFFPPKSMVERELFPESVSDYVSGHLILRWCTHWKLQTVCDNPGADQWLSLSFFDPVEWIVFLHISLVLLAILKHWRKCFSRAAYYFLHFFIHFPLSNQYFNESTLFFKKKRKKNSDLTAMEWPVFLSFSRHKLHANVLASSLNRGHLVHTCLFTEWMTSLLNPTLPFFLKSPRFIFLLFL